jgi:predicted RNase H-like HicB family nuclease
VKYKIPVTVIRLEDGSYMARCSEIRATATGEDAETAVQNLLAAVREMVDEFGEARVFQDFNPESDLRVLEVAL